MCVIYVADQGVRPTEEMIQLGWDRNPEGAGAAWRSNGKVKWRKGMSLEEIQKLNKTLPFPYVIHLRAASPGTDRGPEMNHPFEVAPDASVALKGTTESGVLFHNGFWCTNWREKIIEAAICGGWELPDGPYSDSRCLAILASRVGGTFLEFLDKKVVWFKPNEIQMYGNGWFEYNKVACSNMEWREGARKKSDSATQGGRGGEMGFTRGSQQTTSSDSTASTGSPSTEKSGGASQQARFPKNQGGERTCGTGSQRTSREGQKELREESPQSGATSYLGTGVAEQHRPTAGGASPEPASGGTSLILSGITSPAILCIDCKKEKASIHTWVGNVGYPRCSTCHETYRKGKPASGTVFEQFPAIKALCEFCNTRDAYGRTKADLKMICMDCWIHRQRPPAQSFGGRRD